jgi:hypothetical protein
VYDAGDLGPVIRRLRVEELVFSGDSMDPVQRQSAVRVCGDLGVPVRELIFEIREPPPGPSGASGPSRAGSGDGDSGTSAA